MENREMYAFVKELDSNNAINEIGIALDLIRNAYRRCTNLNIHQVEKIEALALDHAEDITKLYLALGNARATKSRAQIGEED